MGKQGKRSSKLKAKKGREHCPKMLPPYQAHGPHDNCAGLAAHPNVMIGRR